MVDRIKCRGKDCSKLRALLFSEQTTKYTSDVIVNNRNSQKCARQWTPTKD